MPGDPLNAIAPANVITALKSAFDLDKPASVQYSLWLLHAVQGVIGVLVGCALGALAGY